MKLALVLSMSFMLACTQRAELFRSDADGSLPGDGGASGGDGGATDGGTGSDGSTDEDGGNDADAGRDASTPPDDDAGEDGGAPAPRIVLTTGLDHVCAIVDGTLWWWGLGEHAQLGLGGRASQTRPTRVDDNDDWVAVCGGEEHSCALRADRSLYCWGRNFHGELGVGDFTTREEPALVPGASFVRIACGGWSTCGLTGDGALWCWGDNVEGKLGQDDDFATAKDSAVPLRVAPGTAFREVAVGQGHVCVVATNGALWCWGRNTNGQLGIQTPQEQQRSPARVTGLDDVREVAAGMTHTCASKANGELLCWGADTNDNGVLGLGSDVDSAPRPETVGSATSWGQVSVLWFHSCALRNGDAYCWGRNDEGQLGLGDNQTRFVPQRLAPSGGWQGLYVGHFHTCGVRDGAVWCWGNNEAGQVGVGDMQRRDVPTEVTFR